MKVLLFMVYQFSCFMQNVLKKWRFMNSEHCRYQIEEMSITMDFNFRGFAWWTMKSTRISNPRIISTFTVYDTTQMHVVVYLWLGYLSGCRKLTKLNPRELEFITRVWCAPCYSFLFFYFLLCWLMFVPPSGICDLNWYPLSCLRPLAYLFTKTNYLASQSFDHESYSRNASWALNSISTFLLMIEYALTVYV